MADTDLRTLERARLKGDLRAHVALVALRERLGLPKEIPEVLDSYGMGQIFGAGGVEECHWGGDKPRAVPPGSSVPTDGFARWDVKAVHGFQEGENEGPHWMALVELWDGRWAFLDGSCDYTGFD